jgi:hypothetical protein
MMKKYSLIIYIREETKQNLKSIDNWPRFESEENFMLFGIITIQSSKYAREN